MTAESFNDVNTFALVKNPYGLQYMLYLIAACHVFERGFLVHVDIFGCVFVLLLARVLLSFFIVAASSGHAT